MAIKIPKEAKALFFFSLLFAIGYLIPYTLGLAKAGFLEPDIAEQFNIYSDIILFAFGTILIYLGFLFWKGNNKYGDNFGFYNKDETYFGKRFTYWQITLISIITFGGLFLLANSLDFLKKGAFGLKTLPTQQFSPVDSLLVSSLQIPIAENFMAVFSMAIIVLALTIIAVKYKWKKENFQIYKVMAVTIGLGVLGYLWHQTVYGTSDLASSVVALFWALGGFISIITGSFIPFLAMHITNNFFIDFGRLYSSDLLIGTVITVLVGVGILLYLSLRKKRES